MQKMCHIPADIFQVDKRAYLKEGYYADMTLINPNSSWKVEKSNILYKCGWSPLEGTEFSNKIQKTFVNGELVYDEGEVIEASSAMALDFVRY